MTRTAPRPVEINLLRYLPGDTPLHHMWAGTKLLALTAASIAAGIWPTWRCAAALGALVVVALVVARIPRGTAPRLPVWFWAGIGLFGLGALVAGGAPDVRIGEVTVGLGGFLTWLRVTTFTVVFFAAAAVLGWTTRLADLGPAVRRLLWPLRILRAPVDELAAVVGLCVRCFPLLVDEMRTMHAAWRMRRPPVRSVRERIDAVHDLLVTGLVASLRRAVDMAAAIEARGGLGAPPEHVRLGRADLAAAVATIAALAAGLVR